MKKLILTFLCVLSFISFSQKDILNETFDNNKNLWVLPSNQIIRSNIASGQYQIKNQGVDGESITMYLNRLDTKKDFTIRSTISVSSPGSQFGLTWGGINHKDAFFFVIKGFDFSIFATENGMVIPQKEMTKSIRIKPTSNELKIERRGNQVSYFINGIKVHEMPFTWVKGNAFGFNVWGGSAISVEDFVVNGTQLPILEAPNLYYTEKPENLRAVNSQYDEMVPVISPSGKRLYFSRAYDPQNAGGASDYQDAYVSDWSGSTWSAPKNLGAPVNNSAPNAVNAVTPDGNTLLLMNTYEVNGKPKGMGLSVSSMTTNGWGMPQDVKMRSFYNRSRFNEFFLSNDGMVILMAVDREGTVGSRDLYVSFYEGNGIWSAPKSLGQTVNTPGTELSPFLASDGKTLYFSSNGHPGYGKNDVFITKRLDNSWTRWSTPKNVGKPINGPGRNAYYSVPASGDYAYFVSDEGSLGKGDIFKVKLPSAVKPDPIVLVKGNVLNKKTRKPIGTSITIHDMTTGKEVGIAHSSPVDGYYEIVLPPGKTYSFYAEEEGFYSIKELEIVKKSQKLYAEIERDLYLTPIEVGQAMQMHNVLFERGLPKLKSGSFRELDELVEMMYEVPEMRVEIGGHTDNQGSAELNVKLSEQRVETVTNYLIDAGIEEDRIEGKGYGGSKPAYPNNSEYYRQKNRRVEFTILEY